MHKEQIQVFIPDANRNVDVIVTFCYDPEEIVAHEISDRSTWERIPEYFEIQNIVPVDDIVNDAGHILCRKKASIYPVFIDDISDIEKDAIRELKALRENTVNSFDYDW